MLLREAKEILNERRDIPTHGWMTVTVRGSNTKGVYGVELGQDCMKGHPSQKETIHRLKVAGTAFQKGTEQGGSWGEREQAHLSW